ncbi:MAG: hypothetical protein NVV82_00285 [Sporocytophaga sp.]|nr:hypothetical protein [Sporocytophaga sp.]
MKYWHIGVIVLVIVLIFFGIRYFKKKNTEVAESNLTPANKADRKITFVKQ